MSGFTTYIFKTDADTLKANAKSGASGSLFGLWTSTGNPVIRVIMGKGEAKTEGQRLYEAYRLYNIGEWRTVARNDRDGRQRIAQSVHCEKQCGQAAAGKILILDINDVTGITPYLYTLVFIQTPTQHCELWEKIGKMEFIDGENPFSRDRRRQSTCSQISALGNSPPAYQPYTVPQSQEPGLNMPSAHTRHEIDILPHQWYSNEKQGHANVQFVLEELKKIAVGDKLDISRDTTTHNLTVMFTDNRYRRSWTMKFPSRFPQEGASVSYKNWSSSGTEYSSLRDTKEPSCGDVRVAMRRIVRYITEKGPIR